MKNLKQVADEFKNILKELSYIVDNLSTDIRAEEFETLTLDRLVDVAKNNVVPNADGMAVILTEDEDDEKKILFLANVNKGQLLDKKDNKYVKVKADSLKKDVRELFGNNNIIILK